MKKKILGTLVFLVGALGVMFFMGVFSAGEATKEDHAQGETTAKELEGTYDNIEMPDFEEDSVETDVEEEFDAEAML